MKLILERLSEDGLVVKTYKFPIDTSNREAIPLQVRLMKDLASAVMFRDFPEPTQWRAWLGAAQLNTTELLGDLSVPRPFIIEGDDGKDMGKFMAPGGRVLSDEEAKEAFEAIWARKEKASGDRTSATPLEDAHPRLPLA